MTEFVPGLYRFAPPQQFSPWMIDGKHAYHDCADCQSPEAVMHGCLRGADGAIGVMEMPDGRLFFAVFCETCFRARVEQKMAGGSPALNFYVVYSDPTDYPGKIVVRRFNNTKPDAEARFVGDTIEEARASLPAGLLRLDRFPADDAKIVEVWL